MYEASVTLIPKLDNDAKGTLQTNIPYEYRCGNPQQNTVKLNPATYGKNYISWPHGIYHRNSTLVHKN